ncbi:MAG: CAP domain-containing protein [Actinomycetota bacterium]|nr:CAP domain-containing protein [Actinomycetota bacterium]
MALAAPAGAGAADCANVSARPSSISSKAAVKSTVCLINQERSSHGLRRMRLNGRLSSAAARHGGDMVRRDYFSHVSPSGSTFLERIRRTGYLGGARSWWAGENIAWGSGRRGTPRSIVRAWMRSPSHRANVLNGRFREIGIAVVRGSPAGPGRSAATYVNTFGDRG